MSHDLILLIVLRLYSFISAFILYLLYFFSQLTLTASLYFELFIYYLCLSTPLTHTTIILGIYLFYHRWPPSKLFDVHYITLFVCLTSNGWITV